MPAPESNARDLRRHAAEVAEHPSHASLGALCFDLLSRQAEGRTLLVARELVERRAAEHGVNRDDARTGVGNLVTILERGPDSDAERATVVAFAVHGLAERVRSDGADESALVARFLRHAEWLELSTPYVVLPFVDAVLPVELAAHAWRELAQRVVDEASGPAATSPASRARNAARLSALAASSSDAARAALSSVVASTAIDAPTLQLATALGGSPAASSSSVSLRGRAVSPDARGATRALRWVSGWALLAWVGRLVASLVGSRREIELRTTSDGVEVHEERFLLGRRVRESRGSIHAIASARRDARYPSMHLAVGAIALSAGLLFGGLVAFDGVRSGELALALAGAALALAGALLDLVLGAVVPGARARVRVELRPEQGPPTCVADVPQADADRFLAALRG